jgi:2-polyprenyl-3-methyl-5-hydroxy-6-metoxy-1,4-benzoquinol methylase
MKLKEYDIAEIPRRLIYHLENTDWNTFLDLGCGRGSFLYLLNERGYLKNKTVYAGDISQKNVSLTGNISRDFQCFVCNACSLENIGDSSIDFVVSNQVIEHVEDDALMIREIKRILSPGGTLYLSTIFKKKYAWFYKKHKGKSRLDPTHIREYTNDTDLPDIINENGLDIIENSKGLFRYPIKKYFLKVFKDNTYISDSHIFDKIRIAIPGYYVWELVCKNPG